jgi:hypothetical protein
MTYKKGDRVRDEDGQAGEILFVDKGGLEAQVAFHRVTLKLRTESLSKMAPDEPMALAAAPAKPPRPAAKRTRSLQARNA